MPADDEITSLTGAGSESTERPAHAIFSTTNWSVVLEAQGRSPAAQEALEKLCRTYWRPVYSFIRREGTGPEEAEDLTQSFFALLVERRNFDAVRKEKGRLRSYLLTSLKHFLVSEHRRAVTLKRAGEPLRSLWKRTGEALGVRPSELSGSMQLTTRIDPDGDGLTTAPAGEPSLQALETSRRESVLRDPQRRQQSQLRAGR